MFDKSNYNIFFGNFWQQKSVYISERVESLLKSFLQIICYCEFNGNYREIPFPPKGIFLFLILFLKSDIIILEVYLRSKV